MLENWPFNSFFRSKCLLSHQIRLQAFIFPLRGVVFLHPVLQSVGMSLYVVLFMSMCCGDYSITTFTLHFWTVQGYVIYWVIPHFFEKLSVSALLAFHRELADPAAVDRPPTHSQHGFRWACLPLYGAFHLCQANSDWKRNLLPT